MHLYSFRVVDRLQHCAQSLRKYCTRAKARFAHIESVIFSTMRSSSVASRASRVKENSRPAPLAKTLKSATGVLAPAPLRSARKPILGSTGAGPVAVAASTASTSVPVAAAAPAIRQPLFKRPTLEAIGLPSFVEEIDRVFERKDYASILASMWKSKPPGMDFKVGCVSRVDS